MEEQIVTRKIGGSAYEMKSGPFRLTVDGPDDFFGRHREASINVSCVGPQTWRDTVVQQTLISAAVSLARQLTDDHKCAEQKT